MTKPRAKAQLPASQGANVRPGENPDYQRTKREQAAYDTFVARQKERAYPIAVLRSDGRKSEFDHPDQVTANTTLAAAVGMVYGDEVMGLLQHAYQLTTDAKGEPDTRGADRFLASVAAIGPKDSVESMLAMQMVALHEATMSAAWKLRKASVLEHAQLHTNQVNKLSRAFAGHVETLKRYRSSGDQKMTVVHEHKHVHLHNEAGTEEGGGVKTEIEGQSHERDRVLSAERAAMLGFIEADRMPVPGAGIDGQERVSVPRRQGGSPKGER